MPDSIPPTALAVTLTVEQLDRRIERAVAKALESRAPSPPEVMNTRAAAAFIAVHPATLQRMTRAGEIPVHLVASERRYRRSELLAWLDSRKAS